MRTKEQYQSIKKVHEIQGNLNFIMDAYGDHIAEREGYNTHEGIQAIHFYLIQKYHWTLATVRQLSFEDLEFLLCEEKKGWTLPKGLRNL
ncbi:hypothetical protein [Marinomonas sp.]|uniref:hypothetical protein n=1 Tax=Marinomonas sp. TaxID=1904862 RepID=UPI003BAAB3BF